MASQGLHTGADTRGAADTAEVVPPRTPEEVRRQFPATVKAAYLNAAASSPLCVPVERALADHLRETMERGDAGFLRWLGRKEALRAAFAAFIGGVPEELAFTSSTSMGFHAIARLFKWRDIKEVVTLEAEFPSTTIPLLAEGITLRAVKARPDGSFRVEDVEAAITPNTGAIALSQVQFASGFLMDVKRVGELARSRGLTFALNACQAMGQVRVDVRESQADFICGTSHKWLMAGFGGGIFYGRASWFAGETPPWAGWLSVEKPWLMDPLSGANVSDEGNVKVAHGSSTLRHSPGVLEGGSHAWTPIFGLEAALSVLNGVGIDAIAAHNRSLQSLLRRELRARGFVPNAPDDQVAGMCVIKVNAAADEAAKALSKEGVLVSARMGGLRISTHVFNTSDDVLRLCEALERLKLQPG